MTDYKALCARMADELDHYRQLLMDDRRETHALATEARAALAQPEPEGPSDEELLAVAAGAINPYETCGIAIGEYEAETECAIEVYGSELIAFARAVLARWGTPNSAEIRRSMGDAPQPVPVSERLPGPEDCDAEGRCWWYGEGGDMVGWTLDAEGPSYYRAKYWLPAHALPVPTND
jgi:hypothetical protein